MWVVVYLFRRFRDFLVDSFTTSAPVSLEVAYLLIFGFSFNGLLVVVAAVVYVSSISLLEMTLLANRKSVLDLFNFVEKVNPANFSAVSTESWLKGLENDGVSIDTNSSWQFRTMFKSLKVFVAKDTIPEGESLPVQIVTFPTLLGNWIFVPARYENMNGLEKFQLLHEIGHLNMRAISLSKYNSAVGVLVVMLVALFVLYREGFGMFGVLAVVALLLLELLNTYLMSSNKLVCQVADEMEADSFAFKHAKKEWFKQFPAKAVAERFCLRSGHSRSTQQVWIDHFVDALERLREGGSQDDCLDKHYPKASNKWALTAVRYLQAAVFCSVLFLYGAPELGEAVSLLVISMVFFLVVTAFASSVKSMGELLLRSFSKREDRDDAVRYMRKYVSWYTTRSERYSALQWPLLARARDFCLKQLEAHEALSEELNPIANVEGSLFESQADFDIYCDRKKAVNYIFHGKDINYQIDHLEFNIATRRITAITQESKRLDLGAKIGSPVFPYLAREQYIFIVKTENGKALGGVQVYMKLVTA